MALTMPSPPLWANVVYGTPRPTETPLVTSSARDCTRPLPQREDEYGLRARSETTSNKASNTKFITTEEPP
jgi:hypothetical protein